MKKSRGCAVVCRCRFQVPRALVRMLVVHWEWVIWVNVASCVVRLCLHIWMHIWIYEGVDTYREEHCGLQESSDRRFFISTSAKGTLCLLAICDITFIGSSLHAVGCVKGFENTRSVWVLCTLSRKEEQMTRALFNHPLGNKLPKTTHSADNHIRRLRREPRRRDRAGNGHDPVLVFSPNHHLAHLGAAAEQPKRVRELGEGHDLDRRRRLAMMVPEEAEGVVERVCSARDAFSIRDQDIDGVEGDILDKGRHVEARVFDNVAFSELDEAAVGCD